LKQILSPSVLKVIGTATLVKEIKRINDKVATHGTVDDKDIERILRKFNVPKREEIMKAIKKYRETKDEEEFIKDIAKILGVNVDEFMTMIEILASILS